MKLIKAAEYNKKGVCQCRSCNHLFMQNEAIKKDTEHLGQTIPDLTCPICGSNTYGLVFYPIDEYQLTYKNGKFYGVSNQYIKLQTCYNELIDMNGDE